MDAPNPSATPPRRKIGRGARIVLVFVGLFLVLQIGEGLWRRMQPERPPQSTTTRQATAPLRPSVQVRDDRIMIEYARHRSRIGIQDEADRQAMESCVRERLERVFGPLDAEGPLPEPASTLTRREARAQVQQVTDDCVFEVVDVQIPPVAPRSPTR